MTDLMETGVVSLNRERRLRNKLDEVLKDRIPQEMMDSPGFKALVSLMTFAFYEGVKFEAQESMMGVPEPFTLNTNSERGFQ